MAIFLPIVFCMAESGIGISRKTPRTKHLREGRTWPRVVYVCDVCARVRAKETHVEASPHTS